MAPTFDVREFTTVDHSPRSAGRLSDLCETDILGARPSADSVRRGRLAALLNALPLTTSRSVTGPDERIHR